MKKTLFFALLTLSLGSSYAQTNSNSDWDLNKYLWSHTHHDATKSGKPVIDFDIMDNWRSVGTRLGISPDARYFLYDVIKGQNTIYDNWSALPDEIILESVDHSWRHVIKPKGADLSGFFSKDGKQFIYQEKESLTFLTLGGNQPQVKSDIVSFKVPSGTLPERTYNTSSEWIAISFKNKDLVLQNLSNGKEERFTEVSSYEFDKSGHWLVVQTAKELMLYSLEQGKKQNFPAPQSYMLPNAQTLMLTRESGLESVDLTTGSVTKIWKPRNSQESLSGFNLDSSNKQAILSVKTSESDAKDAPSSNSIWWWKEGMQEPKLLLDQKGANLAEGFSIQSGAAFTDNGRYITFLLQKPAKVYEAIKGAPKLMIWSSRDMRLQTTQAKHKADPTMLTATLNVENGKILYITKENESSFVQGDYVLIQKEDKLTDRFWDPNFGKTISRIFNLKNGTDYPLGTAPRYASSTNFSPTRNYVIYFDYKEGNYYSIDLRTSKKVNICQGLKPWYFEAEDWFSSVQRPAKQVVKQIGWLKDDQGFLVYDNYDLWQLDPAGNKAPICLTNGYGKANQTIFKIADEPSGMPVITDKQLLLVAFNKKTIYNGYYRTQIGSARDPEKLSMGPFFIQGYGDGVTHVEDPAHPPLKAADADVWMVKYQTPETGSNYSITRDFKTYTPLTSLLPSKNVNWYTRELHRFKCLDGTEGEGILYKPENFDPKKKYPVYMPFYGQFTSDLYVYQNPTYPGNPMSFSCHPAWFVSHGYLVFVPKIYIAPLKYGPAAFNVVEGAAKYLQSVPYVDGKHIGAGTHSWSSKLGAYLFTHSKYVTAIAINEGYLYGNVINGALTPTDDDESDLDSVENGFEYGELWKNKESWIDQTTVLNLDKAKIPLLLSSSAGDFKKEYARQGFQIYTGLRRLDKPVWWFQYSSMQHNIVSRAEQKDYAIRLMQFFDHYFKGAPAPVWMTQGLPNAAIGAEPRLDFDPSGSCGDHCAVCKKHQKSK